MFASEERGQPYSTIERLKYIKTCCNPKKQMRQNPGWALVFFFASRVDHDLGTEKRQKLDQRLKIPCMGDWELKRSPLLHGEGSQDSDSTRCQRGRIAYRGKAWNSLPGVRHYVGRGIFGTSGIFLLSIGTWPASRGFHLRIVVARKWKPDFWNPPSR